MTVGFKHDKIDRYLGKDKQGRLSDQVIKLPNPFTIYTTVQMGGNKEAFSRPVHLESKHIFLQICDDRPIDQDPQSIFKASAE